MLRFDTRIQERYLRASKRDATLRKVTSAPHVREKRRRRSSYVDRFTATTNGLSLSARLWVTKALAALLLSFRARWGISAGIKAISPGLQHRRSSALDLD
jgi:hypothetical protein